MLNYGVIAMSKVFRKTTSTSVYLNIRWPLFKMVDQKLGRKFMWARKCFLRTAVNSFGSFRLFWHFT